MLHSMAIEGSVLEGRPRELIEGREAFRLVVDYFVGKVAYLDFVSLVHISERRSARV